MPRALLFANTDWYLYNFRLPLAKALVRRGWTVHLVSPPGDYAGRLVDEGFDWHCVDLSRKGTNPFVELATLMRVIRLYGKVKPDVAHHFTMKCIAHGGIAAIVSGAMPIHALTGLGHVFTTPSLRNSLLRPLLRLVLRLAFRSSDVIFQNPDDLQQFQEEGLLNSSHVHLIQGSGVNCSQFVPANSKSSLGIAIVMVARLIREKGVAEFVEAARIVRQANPAIRFLLVGGEDVGNPSSISPTCLRTWRDEGIVEFLGHRSDMREILQQCDVAVLPSHREGTPRSLLEAAACGLPLIATDVPGCREVVRSGENGLLVRLGDVGELATAMSRLANDATLRAEMGRKSRELAVSRFSEEIVLENTLQVYESALARKLAIKERRLS